MDKPRYSIWLVPSQPAQAQFAQAIIDLAKRYQSPWFVPHMTVSGDVEIGLDDLIQKLEPVAEQAARLTVQIDKIEIGHKYYQCVYAKLIKSRALIKLYEQTCAALNRPADPGWLAHSSLLYGDFDDTIKLEAKKVAESLVLPTSFTADKLSIRLSGPDPKNWPEMKKLPFKE
jgi:hypothetical protein